MGFLREGLSYFSERAADPDPVLKAFHSVVFEKAKGRKGLAELYNQLRSICDGRPGAAEASSPRVVLEWCVAYRNRAPSRRGPRSAFKIQRATP